MSWGLDWVEVLGYLAAGLIVAALTMSSMLRLRLVNASGSMLFISYGIVLGVWPVVVLNSITLTINAVHVRRLVLKVGREGGARPDLEATELPRDRTKRSSA